jgi:hypothetical protein
MQRKIVGALGNTMSRVVPGVVGLLQLAVGVGLLWLCFGGVVNSPLVNSLTRWLLHALGWR